MCTKRAFSAGTLATTSDTTREMNGGLISGLKANQARWSSVAFLSVVGSSLQPHCKVSLTVVVLKTGAGVPAPMIAMSASGLLGGLLRSACGLPESVSLGFSVLICAL